MNETYNQAMVSFMSAGKAKPKQNPCYGKARRLAKKIGAKIEVERCYPHSPNIWIHFGDLASQESFPLDEPTKFAEDWGQAHSILESVQSAIK